MHLSVINWIKRGMLLLFSVFVLTACSGKEEFFLESGGQEEMWETEEVSDFSALSGEEAALTEEKPEEDAGNESKPQEIYVHICGAVVNPGVYVLTEGSRIFEGIEAAGGFLENACKDYVNLAKPLQDGQQLAIPTMEEVEIAKENGIYQELWLEDANAAGEAEVSFADGDGLININTATESELGSMNGIGPSKAAAIVAYRKENGGFASIEEIMKVSGIGESTYEKIKGRITVN